MTLSHAAGYKNWDSEHYTRDITRPSAQVFGERPTLVAVTQLECQLGYRLPRIRYFRGCTPSLLASTVTV